MAFLSFLRANAPFLLVGVLLTFCSSFGQTFFIAVFADPLRTQFNLTNGEWGLLYSVGTTASAVLMVWTGILTDTFRVRILGPIVLILLALACLSMALIGSVWALAVTIFALRFTGQGMATLVATVAMARWFVVSRGKALSVSKIGVALGEAFLPLIFVSLMTDIDWKSLWMIAAVGVLALVPLLWPLLRLERTPQSIARDDQNMGMGNIHWARGRMLRHSLFWLMVPALLAPAAFSTAFFFHQVHVADSKGWSHIALVSMFPVFTVSATGAMFLSGWIVDRIGTARLMPYILLPMAAGFAVFGFASNLAVGAAAMALMGLTQGANNTVNAAFWAEFFGTRYLGGIKALATAIMVLGTAIGPALTGGLIDMGLAFDQQMLGIALYFIVSSALVCIGVARARPSLSLSAKVNIEGA